MVFTERSFHPTPQTQPITVKQAWMGVQDDGTGKRVGPHTKIWKDMKNVKPGESDPHHFSHQRLHADRPSPTLRKANGLAHYHLWHPTEHRVITLAECKRIASFPDDFEFVGSIANAWDRIGNCVPPRFMQAIAEYVYDQFLDPNQQVRINMPLDFIDKPINPPGPYKFQVISTFAGCGGSSLGYKWAGGKVLVAVEWEENAVATYRLNHKGTQVLHRDITTVTVEELLQLTRLQPGELDILDGSPPCQGFSIAGKRQMDDPRNSLFKEYVRLLRGLQPKVFVMENVSGMVKGEMKHIFAIILRELKASGYRVKCQLMNVMYFGVPQSRERVIFIGIRDDLEVEPGYPSAITNAISPRTAFEGVTDQTAPSLPPWLKKAAQEMKPGHYGDDYTIRAFLKYKGSSGGYINTKLLSWDKCSCTIIKSEIAHTGIIHPNRKRYLSIGEMKRIASFPDAFQFIGTRKNVVERLGNCVPPRFMQAIAEHQYNAVLAQKGRIVQHH